VIHVAIEQRHIDSGVAAVCTQCPIALAVSEILGVDVLVTPLHVRTRGTRHPLNDVAELPHEARLWLMRFDAGDHVEPISFPLDFDPPWHLSHGQRRSGGVG
jgi:hypothetical protein